MKIEIRIDSSYSEPHVIVLTDHISGEVTAIMQRLSDETTEMLTGMKDECLEIIDPDDVVRIYSESGKVFAETTAGEYVMRSRLYELEEKLDRQKFVRISNSEIINLRRAKNFDLSIAGTICVRMSSGSVSYVSRRYVTKIKHMLGLK